ncbi:Neurofilament medium polypeptide [Folsomia candida]|uniref:Neurofilament medium polypeptide n=1 Tax=Folsomia candida TaxID=158441 RepID=A0A226EZF8_FOLCA|nr:Neurofilament medium polypeptide [Folsomia candida]
MKRSSLDQSAIPGTSDAEGETGVRPQKRRSSENKVWEKFFEEKQKDFAIFDKTASTSKIPPSKPRPSKTPPSKTPPSKPRPSKTPPSKTPPPKTPTSKPPALKTPPRKEPSDDEEYEIEEYDSPTKSLSNSDTNQNTDIDGTKKKKYSLVEEMKALLTPYDNSVRRFPQYIYGDTFEYDESQAVTLIIRHVCGTWDKLVWTICRLVERDIDRCVMFRPLYLYDIKLGGVLKLYPPWQELEMPEFPMPILMCTDFYRLPLKREKNFGVSHDTISALLTPPNPFRGSGLNFLLSKCTPFHLSNQNTISIQTKAFKPSIDLNTVMYPVSCRGWPKLSQSSVLICDSDHVFAHLQLSELESGKRERIYKAINPGKYIKFRKLGVVSKTSILEDFSWFKIFQGLGSNQKVFYTLCFRHDTEWKEEANLDFPYRPPLGWAVKPWNDGI